MVALCAVKEYCSVEDLLQIAADGEVDELEVAGFRQILADLDEIVQAALQVKFAEDKEEGLL